MYNKYLLVMPLCSHNKKKYYCKDCNGGQFCEHNRV